MLDDKLSDDEIREIWAEHFPKRLDEIKSQAVCDILRQIVEKRAAIAHAQRQDEIIDSVAHELAGLGIPRDEFYQLEKETDDE